MKSLLDNETKYGIFAGACENKFTGYDLETAAES